MLVKIQEQIEKVRNFPRAGFFLNLINWCRLFKWIYQDILLKLLDVDPKMLSWNNISIKAAIADKKCEKKKRTFCVRNSRKFMANFKKASDFLEKVLIQNVHENYKKL